MDQLWTGQGAPCEMGDDRYLEIAAPDPHQQAETGTLPFDLDLLEGPRLVGWVARCENIVSSIGRARERGCDFGEPLEGNRKTQDGDSLNWWATTETICEGMVPFLIEWGEKHPSQSAPHGLDLVSFRLEHPTPDAVEPWLAALALSVDVIKAAEPALVATIAGPKGTVELR